jgi:hypothetical protein
MSLLGGGLGWEEGRFETLDLRFETGRPACRRGRYERGGLKGNLVYLKYLIGYKKHP